MNANIRTSETINSSSIRNARIGYVGDKKTLVTHRNPDTGEYWCEDIKKGDDNAEGCWVPSDIIKFKK